MAMVILIGSMLFCAGVQAHNTKQTTHHVQHVVICWLKHPGNTEERERLIAASHQLAALPGVISVEAGQAIVGDRPMVDSSFDVGVVFTFSDEAALRAYERNPVHIQAVQETLLPLVEKILVYDFSE